MKKPSIKRMMLSALLAVLFFLSACLNVSSPATASFGGATLASKTGTPALPYISHQDVALSDMNYMRPDIDGMYAAMDDLRDGIRRGQSAEDMIAAYRILLNQYSHADSMLSLIYLMYAFDVTNENNRDEYAYLQSALSELDAQMQGTSALLFESSEEAKQLARESFGEGYVEAILSDNFYDDPAIQDLLEREEALTLEYDNLIATFSLIDDGTRWTYGKIVSDEALSDEEYYRLYDAYCAALNSEAGPIFLEQAAIRGEIASLLGYSDYATYCYDTYGRDYSLADARALHHAVKTYIAPVFITANEQNDTSDLYAAYFKEETFFKALSSAANTFSPLLAEPVSFMLQNRLYDVAFSSVKMDSREPLI